MNYKDTSYVIQIYGKQINRLASDTTIHGSRTLMPYQILQTHIVSIICAANMSAAGDGPPRK